MTEKTKSTFGLDKNVACALTYVLGWVSGLVFFLAEKQDKDIRFHALQSIIFFGALNVIAMVPVLGWTLRPLISLLGFAAYLFLIIKAYQGEKFMLPVIGEIAKKQINR